MARCCVFLSTSDLQAVKVEVAGGMHSARLFPIRQQNMRLQLEESYWVRKFAESSWRSSYFKRREQFFIALSGGHPRSYQLILERLEKSGTLQKSNAGEVEDSIWRAWEVDVARDAPHLSAVSDEIWLNALAMAIVDQKTPLSGVVAEGWPVSALISSGLAVQSIDANRDFVELLLSLPRLAIWAREGERRDGSDEATWVRGHVLSLLQFEKLERERFLSSFHSVFTELRCWAWHRRGLPAQTTLQAWAPFEISGAPISLTVLLGTN